MDFDDVIIDEAQDFDNKEILYFKDLTELRDGHFFVFYDKNQLVTAREVPEWIRDSECKLILTKNCRNTREIALTSYNVIDVELKQKIMMVRGEQTSISFVRGESLPKLAQLLKMLTGDKYGYEYSDIVILSLKKEENSILNGVNKLAGVPILREKSNSAVLFTTSRKFKGLEADAVILVDVDSETFNSQNVLLYYVGTSRARLKLDIVTMFNDDDCVDILVNKLNYSGKIKKPKKELAGALNSIGSIAE